MEGIVALFVILVVLVAIVFSIRLLSKQRIDSSIGDSSIRLDRPKVTFQQDLKTYRIFTLGTSGAGKTCFMASMFNCLSSYKPDVGFYLETANNKQRILLTNTYSQITDSYKTWPSGTTREEEWHFISVVSAKGENYPVFRFIYLDYAGGNLTDIDRVDELNAQAKIEEADAVLVLLDGQKIIRRLENREDLIEDPSKRIGAELSFMLPYLMKAPRKPLHFVVSKWDLFEGRHSIADIYDCLSQYDNFTNLINLRKQLKIPTRLIPVSAVGNGFASMNEDGSMEKNIGVLPKPYQVEMSIASTLIDAFQAKATLLDEQVLKQLERVSNNKNTPSEIVLSLLEEGSGMLKQVAPFPLNFAPIAAVKLLRVIHDKVEKNRQDLEVEQRKVLALVKDQETAINSVITSYQLSMVRLESSHPDSVLS